MPLVKVVNGTAVQAVPHGRIVYSMTLGNASNPVIRGLFPPCTHAHLVCYSGYTIHHARGNETACQGPFWVGRNDTENVLVEANAAWLGRCSPAAAGQGI